jgi:O-antigen/teichoic acid export membrane protein
MVLTSGFRGVMEARRQFGVLNLVRLPLGLFTFIGPVVVLWLAQPRLDTIGWVLAIGRWVGCVLHAGFAMRGLPSGQARRRFDAAMVGPLLRAGGWLTVSNVLSPLMGYVDRFVIGALASAAAVAYYAVPHEIVTKLWILPGALTAVLFPAFAERIARGDGGARALFGDALGWVWVALLPPCLLLFAFSAEILDAWVGGDFASQGDLLMKVLVLGLFVNCFAHVPFTMIQSAGAARLTALIHLAEFPVFIAILWILTREYGPLGAAMAWLIRMIVDTALMFAASGRLLGPGIPFASTATVLPAFAIAVAAFAAGAAESLALRVASFLMACLLCGMATRRLLRRPGATS